MKTIEETIEKIDVISNITLISRKLGEKPPRFETLERLSIEALRSLLDEMVIDWNRYVKANEPDD